jgi:hypothetical protein
MTRYESIQSILEAAVKGDTIGAHGNFWRNKTRDQFVATKVFGQQLLIVGQGSNSNLVKALSGGSPFDGSQYPQMPVGYDPVAAAQIDIIRQWIDDGCPDSAT